MYKNFVLYCLSLVMVGVLLSCGGNGRKVTDVDELHRQDSLDSASDTLNLVPEEDEPSRSVDELFDDFFFTFVTNQKFQMRRIVFPLPWNDGDVARTVGRGEWAGHNRFIFQDVFSVIFEDDEDIAVRNDTSVHRVSIEWIDFETDSADIYTFRKSDGEWFLRTVNRTGLQDMSNGVFLRFLSRFVNDSTFQAESVEQPLRIVASDDMDEGGDGEELNVDAAEWGSIRQEFPLPGRELVNIDYGQPSGSVRYKQVLMVGMNDGMYVKFKFHKFSTDWKLIEIEE